MESLKNLQGTQGPLRNPKEPLDVYCISHQFEMTRTGEEVKGLLFRDVTGCLWYKGDLKINFFLFLCIVQGIN